jgi:hypothetical protein
MVEPELGDFQVPDSVGTILGWRLWRVRYITDSYRLLPLWSDEEWPPRQAMRAACRRGLAHPPPDEGCSCGIYAINERSKYRFRDLAFFRPKEELLVVGQVYLWGRVIEGTRGTRAGIAYPHDLYVVSRSGSEIDAAVAAWGLGKAYDVPAEGARWWDWL